MTAITSSSFSSALNTSLVGGPAPLAQLLLTAKPSAEQADVLRSLRRRVFFPLAVVAALVGAWSAWAPLSGAVVAAGQVQAELGRKVVQHQEGGIVKELLVRQGQFVRRGDPLIVVGDVRSDAAYDMLRNMMEAERVRAERARAELNLASSFAASADASSMSHDVIARERQLFDARRQTLNEQIAATQAQMRDASVRIQALSSQLAANDKSAKLAKEELDINTSLAESGFVQKTRLLSLARGVADFSGRTEAARGEIAEAKMQVSALINTLAQLRGVYQQRAADELKEAGNRLRELEDRLRPSQDQMERQTVKAPVDGTVMALRITSPGTAVGPREPLLEIAPSKESLLIELRIDPHDIDNVHKGDDAEVRLSAFNSRSTPLLAARVISVSPDALIDSEGRQSWYAAQVEVMPSELQKHPELRLQAGMPAEVFVTTPARSLFEYLSEPLGLFAERAMREP